MKLKSFIDFIIKIINYNKVLKIIKNIIIIKEKIKSFFIYLKK